MSATTKIQWTDRTWNPVRGCSLVSAGCANCYAMKQAHRFSGMGRPYANLTEVGPKGPRWNGNIMLVPEALDEPLRWKTPARVFVNSMSDLFHEDVPASFISQVYGAMCHATRHTYQILTKRPKRMLDWISRSAYLVNDPPKHIWLGVSIENQATADERIPLLLQAPAAVRFVSAEPLLGPIDLSMALEPFHSHDPMLNRNQSPIDWIIAGGESGPGARPCDVAWIRAIKEQCQAAGIPVFVKQLGSKPFSEPDRISHRKSAQKLSNGFYRFLTDGKGGDWSEWPEDLRVREFPQ